MKKTRRIEFIFEIFRTIISMVIAYLLCIVVMLVVTDNPTEAVYLFSIGPFTSARRFGMIMSRFIPYLFTGVGMCFIYAVNRFNMIGDGVYMLAGCLTAIITTGFGANLPHILLIIVILIACGIMGAIVGSVPTIMDQKFGANEVVVSIMINYIITYVCIYLLKTVLRDPNITYLASMKFEGKISLFEFVKNSNINTGLILGLIVVVVVGIFFYNSKGGFSMRICGENPDFAKYAGLNVNKNVLIAEAIGISLCAIAGAIDIMGVYDRYIWTALPGLAADGLLVAVLARKNPFMVPLGAFLLAYIKAGANILNVNTDIPIEFVYIAQSVIILLIAAKNFMSGLKNRAIIKSAQSETVKEESR